MPEIRQRTPDQLVYLKTGQTSRTKHAGPCRRCDGRMTDVLWLTVIEMLQHIKIILLREFRLDGDFRSSVSGTRGHELPHHSSQRNPRILTEYLTRK